MVSSAVTGMVQPVTKVAGSVGSQSGQDNSGNVDFARIMNSSVRNDVTGNSSKQTNTYSAAPSDSLVSMGANKSNKNADIVTTNSTVKNVKTDNEVKENGNKMTQDVQNAVSDIKEKIKKTMNVSDEDIESAMEQLGIIAEDLLDMQKLTDLVVALSGNTDSLEFLTDADSVSMLNDILGYAKSVTDNLEDVYNMDIDSIKEMLVSAKDDVKQYVKQSVVKEDAQPEERPEAASQYELSNVIAQKTKVQADNDNNADDKQQTHMSDKASVENENFTGNMAQNIQNAFSEIIDEVSNVNEAKSQYNAENRPMTEQQTITQQVQKDINVHSQQVNKKDNADNETGKYDAKDKSNNEYSGEGNSRKKKKSDGKVFVKGQGSADFDVKI